MSIARKSPTISVSSTASNSINWNQTQTLLPAAIKASATTISSSLVSVQPMLSPSMSSPFFGFSYGVTYKIKYLDNVFVKSDDEETEGVYEIFIGDGYTLKDVLKIMNENRSSSEIETLIDDEKLRNTIINILRIIKIRNILK